MPHKTISKVARDRAARLAGKGDPLKDNQRLVRMGTIGGRLEHKVRVKDTKPSGGEYAAVDAYTHKRKGKRDAR